MKPLVVSCHPDYRHTLIDLANNLGFDWAFGRSAIPKVEFFYFRVVEGIAYPCIIEYGSDTPNETIWEFKRWPRDSQAISDYLNKLTQYDEVDDQINIIKKEIGL